MYPNPKPKPPMPGGEYTHVGDPGTPPLPPGTKVVQLIPVGDGGPGTPLPPATRRKKKRKPLLPKSEEIAKLPRLARSAFAARCARRVVGVFRSAWPDAPDDLTRSVLTAVTAAEQADVRTAYDAACAARVAGNSAGKADRSASAFAAWAARDAASDVAMNVDRSAADAALNAVEVILRVASDPRDLLFVRRDFDRLCSLVKANGWTDKTPVPPDVFGPLWPGRVPKWAREANGPRE